MTAVAPPIPVASEATIGRRQRRRRSAAEWTRIGVLTTAFATIPQFRAGASQAPPDRRTLRIVP